MPLPKIGLAMDWDACFAERARRMTASEIRELLKLLDQPQVISFAGGIPDPALFPAEVFAEAYQGILGDAGLSRRALQYSVTEGYGPLRSWLVAHMAQLGVPCHEDKALREQAIAFVPGRPFSATGGQNNSLRLNFSLNAEDQLKEGIARLADIIVRDVARADRLMTG